jgi:hypothetical protein
MGGKGRKYGGARYCGTKTKEGREARGEMSLPIYMPRLLR